MCSIFSLGSPKDFFSTSDFTHEPGYKKGVRFIARNWDKLPSREKLTRVRNSLMDLWRISENIWHLGRAITSSASYNKLFNITSNTVEAVESSHIASGRIGKISGSVGSVLRIAGLFCILSTPYTLWQIGKKSFEVIKGSSSRFDNVFWIIGDVGSILSSIGNFSKGLAGLGLVSASAVGFAGPLNIASSILGIAGTVVNIRSLGQTVLFSRGFENTCELQADGLISDGNFIATLEYLACEDTKKWQKKSRHNRLLGKHFNTDGYKLNLKLEEIRKNPDGLSSYKKAKLVRTLQNRVKTKQFITGLNIISGIVGTSAAVVFILMPLVYPPLVPLGFALAAIGCSTSVLRVAVEWTTEYMFEKKLTDIMDGFTPAKIGRQPS